MTEVEDTLSDEELEEIEDAKLESKRAKTKYGDLIDDGSDE